MVILSDEQQVLFYNIIKEQEKYYHVWYDKKVKQDGSVKYRKITAPNLEYKQLLRVFSDHIKKYSLFPIHPNSYAWKDSISRFDCVVPHINKRYVVEADIKDYFNYITDKHLEDLFDKNITEQIFGNCNENVIQFLTVPNGESRQLPQGFPTSTYFANAVRYNMDCEIAQFAKEHGYTFTSYGDNFFLSGQILYPGLKNTIKDIAEKYNFFIPNKKIHVMPYYNKQCILGITINKKISVPKPYVEKVVKDVISMVKENGEYTNSLRGRVAVLKNSTNLRDYNYVNRLINGENNEQE